MSSVAAQSTHSIAGRLFAMVGAHGGGAGLPPASVAGWSEADWVRLLHLATYNGVTSYVYADLVVNPCDGADAVRLHLRERSYRCGYRGLGLRAELIRLLRAFEAEGIAVMPLKGPLLADRFYRNKSLREFGDLDLLVKEVDRDRAWQLLQRLDYHSPYQNHDLERRYHVVFAHRSTGEIVELHWRIAGPQFGVYFRGDFLWKDARPVAYAGIQVLQPSVEANLLYLAIHAYKHDWSRLQWLLDFPEILASPAEIDWDALDRLAREQHAYRLLRATFQLVKHFFPHAPGVPAGHALGVPALGPAQIRRVVRCLLRPATDAERLGDFYRLRVALAETAGDRLRLIRESLQPSDRDDDFLRWPAALRPFAFLMRPIRLAGRMLLGRSREAERRHS